MSDIKWNGWFLIWNYFMRDFIRLQFFVSFGYAGAGESTFCKCLQTPRRQAFQYCADSDVGPVHELSNPFFTRYVDPFSNSHNV